MSYDRALETLYGLQRFGIKLGLEKIEALLGKLGHPERSFRSLHVAGTNGKGTCAAAAAAVLGAHGVKTGLYTSPHLTDLRERVRVDNRPVTGSFVAGWVARERAYILREKITFFETLTALAFEYFSGCGVVAAVVEVGLGGRWDATNVITPELSVITSIGREHEMYLGKGLPRIAGEKAGIVKPGVPLLCAETRKVALRVILSACRERGSPFLALSEQVRLGRVKAGPAGSLFSYRSPELVLQGLSVPLYGAHQARNLALGLRAAEILLRRLGKAPDPGLARDALEGLVWPGRFQRVRIAEGGEVVLDVAHNPPAAARLARTWRRVYGDRRAVVVVALAADKDYRRFLAALGPLAARFILPAVDFGRADNRSGATDPDSLEKAVKQLCKGVPVERAESIDSALRLVRKAGTETPVLVTGSFRTVGETLRALGLSGL